MLLLSVNRSDKKNCAKYGLDPVSDLDPDVEPELNKSLRFHNTGKSKYEQDTVS
jgi:hypothetical protein